ncbi:MAG: AlkZ family DNA glycosylase [Acidobacteria bacterium]|nr:AlkZ family DNA glycosylase [Acidobacteriota bacterium]
MKNTELIRLRLQQQSIASALFRTPGEIVSWLGAVQAQDYPGGLWAVGLRLPGAVEADVERALAAREIVRTWPMRGTLHFVAAADVRWMLELMTPKIVAANAGRLKRQMGLDEETFVRSKDLFIRALEGGKQLTRNAMYAVLEAGGIATEAQRGLHILGRLAQDGLLCFGPRAGKQPTFALLAEWVPKAKSKKRADALAEIARRYFNGHGPATVQDFVWWSGLTATDAAAGLEMVKDELTAETSGGQTYWLSAERFSPARNTVTNATHFLPVYDEYTVGYKDRSAVLDPQFAAAAGNGIFSAPLVVNGRIAGIWKRTLKKDAVVITPTLFVTLSQTEKRAVETAAQRYGQFLGASVILSSDLNQGRR